MGRIKGLKEVILSYWWCNSLSNGTQIKGCTFLNVLVGDGNAAGIKDDFMISTSRCRNHKSVQFMNKIKGQICKVFKPPQIQNVCDFRSKLVENGYSF